MSRLRDTLGELRGAWLVAVREMRERTRARTFRISTGLIAVLAFGAVTAAAVLPDVFEDDLPVIAFVAAAEPGGVAALLEDGSLGTEATVRFVPDEAEARRLLRDGVADAAVFEGPRLAFRDQSAASIEALVNQAYRLATLPEVLERLDLTLDEAAPLISPQPIPVSLLEPSASAASENDDSDRVVASAAVVLMLMALTLYGSWILNGVVEEKTSRVVEVLMGALRPWQLLLGKVGGILALAIGQIAVGAVAATAAMLIVGVGDLPDVGLEVGVTASVYVVLGLLLYSFVFAAAGATVSRQEDAQAVTLPVTMMLMAGYLLSLTVVVNNPDSVFARLLAMLPFTAPLAMTPRIALGDPPLWEIALSVGLLLVAIPAVINLAGRIYAGAILRTGPRIGLRDAWRSSEETR